MPHHVGLGPQHGTFAQGWIVTVKGSCGCPASHLVLRRAFGSSNTRLHREQAQEWMSRHVCSEDQAAFMFPFAHFLQLPMPTL